ncbi:hypothetical protein T492DRAFT_889123 [Pavlovales sp. CCMP2436]|nr:hypothetical protein T492DRAFT_889123 [Pavlovales sp. CCMP2436]
MRVPLSSFLRTARTGALGTMAAPEISRHIPAGSLCRLVSTEPSRKKTKLELFEPHDWLRRLEEKNDISVLASTRYLLHGTRASSLSDIVQHGLRTKFTNNQQIISLNAFARAHYRRSIGTRGGAQASAAD